MVGVGLPENKSCDTYNETDGYKDCGLGYWPATGWAKDIGYRRWSYRFNLCFNFRKSKKM